MPEHTFCTVYLLTGLPFMRHKWAKVSWETSPEYSWNTSCMHLQISVYREVRNLHISLREHRILGARSILPHHRMATQSSKIRKRNAQECNQTFVHPRLQSRNSDFVLLSNLECNIVGNLRIRKTRKQHCIPVWWRDLSLPSIEQ